MKMEENKKRKRKKRYRHKKIYSWIIIIFALICLFRYVLTREYDYYEVIEKTGSKNSSMTDYVSYQQSLLKYSKDGAVYINEKGEAVWNETFAMKMPKADVCEDYVAVADCNGNSVYVFDQEGKVSAVTMPYRICDIEVASQGEFAVILEGEKENYINIYDKNGTQILNKKTTIDKSGYPMDIDLSKDGTKLFSSYLYLDGVKLKNGLAAYNFGEVGQNENADRMMGGYQLDDTIVPRVEFLNNDTICAFGDKQFIIYSMKEKPSEKARIELEKEVRSVVYNESYIGIVVDYVEDSKKEKKKKTAKYVFELYNFNGRKVMSKDIDFDYKNIRMNQEEIVFTGGKESKIFTLKGKCKFSYAFNRNVMDIISTGYNKRYIVLYDNGSEIIRLKHKKNRDGE